MDFPRVKFSATESVASALVDKPRHVAIIMDGNGRWARQHGLSRIQGHLRGVETVKKIMEAMGNRGIPYLTLFAFSSENWQRPAHEVTNLVRLFDKTLTNEIEKLHAQQIRLRIIGNLSKFSTSLQRKIEKSVALTQHNEALCLTIALNYGGRWDMLQACRTIAQSVASGELSASEITLENIETKLCSTGLPEPDLLIRTGGEQRLSNFMLWQLAYAELYFTDTYWPDFNEKHFDHALMAFAHRQRRFGKIGQQVAALQT